MLTFDVKPGGGLQPLSLAHGSVPHSAPVARAVVLLARQDGEEAGGQPAPGLGLTGQRLRDSLSVPEYLGAGRATLAGAGQVDRAALCGHRSPRGDRGAARLDQHCYGHLTWEHCYLLLALYFQWSRKNLATNSNSNST